MEFIPTEGLRLFIHPRFLFAQVMVEIILLVAPAISVSVPHYYTTSIFLATHQSYKSIALITYIYNLSSHQDRHQLHKPNLTLGQSCFLRSFQQSLQLGMKRSTFQSGVAFATLPHPHPKAAMVGQTWVAPYCKLP